MFFNKKNNSALPDIAGQTEEKKPDLKDLHETLNKLDNKHGEFLKQESVKQDVTLLKYTVEDCLVGSKEAENYLIDHGEKILKEVKEKIDGAVAEQTRLQDEVPSAENFTGGKADRASRASATVTKAKEQLDQVIKDINPAKQLNH